MYNTAPYIPVVQFVVLAHQCHLLRIILRFLRHDACRLFVGIIGIVGLPAVQACDSLAVGFVNLPARGARFKPEHGKFGIDAYPGHVRPFLCLHQYGNLRGGNSHQAVALNRCQFADVEVAHRVCRILLALQVRMPVGINFSNHILYGFDVKRFAHIIDFFYRNLCAARQEQRYGDVQIISNSSHYKLAGNSIVCDVLMYIYEELLYPTGRRLPQEQTDLFAMPQFRLTRDWQKEPLKLVTLCSGYDSQAIAMDMLQQRYPDFRWQLAAWSEFDPESSRPLEEQPAVVAHNLLFPQYKDLNRGDMTKADWSDLKDARIDLLTYSTPCQSISQAGKREGIKKGSGTRSAVLWSTEEAVRQMRPKVLLQENVRALINSVNMPDFREWCSLLESHGYVNFLAPQFPTPWGTDKRDKKTIPGILNAKHYGVPQNRERVYMVSVRADLLGGTQYEFPRPFPLDKCIADVLEDNVDERFFLKPDSVIKFLTVNEQADGSDIHYLVTDHKLSDEEIARARSGE